MTKTAYINCPHCDTRMSTRGHKQISPFYKRLIATCRNNDCLFTCTVDISIAKPLQPSLAPDPEIDAMLDKT